MRRLLVVPALALLLAACGTSAGDPDASASSPAVAPSSADPSTPDADPSPTQTDAQDAITVPPAGSAPPPRVPTALLADVFSGYPATRRGVEEWQMAGCGAGPPRGDVTAMGGAEQAFRSGNATAERQVAVFADVGSAVTEARRLGAVARGCEGTTAPRGFEASTEPLAIGVDSVLLRVPSVDAGQVVGVLRRGTAVGLVNASGVFGAANDLGEVVREGAADLYLQLCPYERGDAC